MKQFTYTITDPVGIHARPAGLLVKADGKSAGGAKLMALMGLGIKQGETVTVTLEGGSEEADAASLEQFFKDNL